MNIINPMNIMIFQTKRLNNALVTFILDKVFSFRYNENYMLEYKKLLRYLNTERKRHVPKIHFTWFS